MNDIIETAIEFARASRSRRHRRGVSSRATPVTPAEIQRACSGDRAALEQLIEELKPVIRVEVTIAVRRRASANVRDGHQEIDDLVHDVLLHLLERGGHVLRRWDPDRGRTLPSFVRLITRHRVARTFEGFKGNPWATEATEPEDLEEMQVDESGTFRRLASREELAYLLQRLQARLDERGLLLFQLIYAEERPIHEVCDAVGMTRAAVDQWTARLRKRVRRLLEESSGRGDHA